MGPKSKRLVVWGAGIQALVVWGAIRRIDGSLGGFFVFFPSFLIVLIKKTFTSHSHMFKGYMSFLYVGCRKFLSLKK